MELMRAMVKQFVNFVNHLILLRLCDGPLYQKRSLMVITERSGYVLQDIFLQIESLSFILQA